MDVYISTTQTQALNLNGLFQFNYNDDNIIFDNVNITYIYDLNDNYVSTTDKKKKLNYWDNYDLCDDYYDISGTCEVNYFQNPVAFIKNYGNVTMNNIVIDVDINYNDWHMEYYNGTDYIGLLYEYNRGGRMTNGNDALIFNAGNMNVINCNIPKSLSYTLFRNIGTLFLHSVTVSEERVNNNFKPNDLQSFHLIVQELQNSQVYIYNCTFVGSLLQVNVEKGTVHIYNSIISHSRAFFRGIDLQSFVMENCELNQIGKFYGAISLDTWQDFDPSTIDCSRCATIRMVNNMIAAHGNAYRPTTYEYVKHTVSVMILTQSDNTFIINNTFVWDTEYIFYDLDTDSILNNFFGSSAMVILISIVDSKVIGNYFDGMSTPTSILDSVEIIGGNYCFSGNTFMSALDVSNANITSCVRPGLINCLFEYTTKCAAGIYGSIDYSLINQSMNTFVINGIFPMVSKLNFSKDDAFLRIKDQRWDSSSDETHIALDNINITIINSAQALASIQYGNLLLVDTIFYETNINHPLHDIKYEEMCGVVYNNRLIHDINYISKLIIKCSPYIYSDVSSYNYNYSWYNYENYYHYEETVPVWENTIDSRWTQFVNYSTPYEIDFYMANRTYYPGQLMKFEYILYDAFGNNIPNNKAFTESEIAINIRGKQFFSNIAIGYNSSCFFCKQGIVINDVTLNDVNSQYNMNIFVEKNELITTNSYDSFAIVGCPQRYGVDEIFYQCSICDTGKYNLFSNTTQRCSSCNIDENNGIECVNGYIYVDHNYWIGFNNYKSNNKIVSSLCPALQCCINSKQCKISVNINNNNINNEQQNTQLCAKNRNPNSMLCSKCYNGYSVSVNSPQCIKCTQNYFSYLLLPLALSLLISLFVMATNTDSYSNPVHVTRVQIDDKETKTDISSKKQKQNWLKKLSKNEYLKAMVSVMISRNIMYYEQSISQLLSSSSISILFASLASIFNLSTTTSQKATNPWCFINGMNGKDKILIDLFVPLFIFILIAIIYLIGKYVYKKQITIMKKRINFAKTFIGGLLIIIGKVLDILFRLLNCKKIGNKYYHFYFAFEECFQATWILSF
eukprot:374600_1